MYLNTLICLEENVEGYGKNGARISGHITITSPGIVKCYVQNLRQLPKEYTVYLVSKNQNKAVRLGCVNSGGTNKQTTWKVDLNNLKGTGVKGTDIDGAAVIVEGDSIGNTDTVLIGYTQGKYLITSMLESALPKKAVAHEKEVHKQVPKATPKEKLKPEKVEVCPEEGPTPVIIPTPDKVEVCPEEGPTPVIIPTPDKVEVCPEEGPTPVIIPTPDKVEVCPEEGPTPVIIPTPDKVEVCPDKKCKKDDDECKVYIPTSEDGDVTEVEILRGLQTAFARTENKEELVAKIECIIRDNARPINKENIAPIIKEDIMPSSRSGEPGVYANKVDKEEEQYLSQIESVLKNIQNNISEELKEKKNLLEDEPGDNLSDKLTDNHNDYKRDIVRVRDVFNDSSAIEPFAEKDANIDWVRISMAELISMPQFSYEWCTNPVITYCYHKFGFLILGKDKQIEQYYIGVPDIYDTKRKFILSIDKIETFRGRNGGDLKPGDYGYWIVRL